MSRIKIPLNDEHLRAIGRVAAYFSLLDADSYGNILALIHRAGEESQMETKQDSNEINEAKIHEDWVELCNALGSIIKGIGAKYLPEPSDKLTRLLLNPKLT